jgi:predicted ATP-grasp superfamily ATP-dependent carboligase
LVAGGARGIVDYLEQCLGELTARYDWIVPCDEPLLVEIASRRDADCLAERIPFLPEQRTLRVLLSNFHYLQEAREAGLPVPEFEVCAGLGAALDQAARLGYPVVIRRDFSMAGSGVKLVRTEDELRAWFSASGERCSVIVQRFVTGRCGMTPMLVNHGRPVRWISMYKEFCWPRAFSGSGGGEITRCAALDALALGVARLHRLHGFVSSDWIQDSKSGAYYLVELNPRVVPVLDVAADLGCDFSEALAAMWSGATPPSDPGYGASPGHT